MNLYCTTDISGVARDEITYFIKNKRFINFFLTARPSRHESITIYLQYYDYLKKYSKPNNVGLNLCVYNIKNSNSIF